MSKQTITRLAEQLRRILSDSDQGNNENKTNSRWPDAHKLLEEVERDYKIWRAIPNEIVESTAKHMGHWEEPDPKKEGEFNHQEVLYVEHDGKKFLVFGGATNAIFLQSGYMEFEEDETLDQALRELHEELEVFYRDGKQFTNRIVCNERM